MTARAAELAKPMEDWLARTLTLLEPSEFDPVRLQRVFRIASTDFGVLSVISPALPELAKRAPLARIEVAAFSDDMMKKLATGDLDLIVTGFDPDRSAAHAHFLFSETQSCVMRSDHPLIARADIERVSLNDYLSWPHIGVAIGESNYDHANACLAGLGASRNVIARVPYFYAAPDLLGSSDAILTLPTRAARRFAASHGFHAMPAPEEIAGFDYWAVWHERSARDAVTQWLVDLLAEVSA